MYNYASYANYIYSYSDPLTNWVLFDIVEGWLCYEHEYEKLNVHTE